jgi:hypothetical protein
MGSYLIDSNGVYDDFVIREMRKIDPETYGTSEFILYRHMDHDNVIYVSEEGEVIAFCVILVNRSFSQMNKRFPQITYTWCDGTLSGKKAYLMGIDFLFERYGDILVGPGALKINKIRRIMNAKL